MSAQFARHPGQAVYPRILSAPAERAETLLLPVRAGRELFEELKAAASRLGVGAMLVRMAGLELREAAVHVVVDGREGRMVDYGDPINLSEGCTLVRAQMVVGREGERVVAHCHGYVRGADGRELGGHLAPGMCQLASDGEVSVTALHGCEFRRAFDEETGFTLLFPTAYSSKAADAVH